jgi:hypothetical protein
MTTVIKNTQVVNLRKSKFDILIDRRTPWGNPFEIGVHGTREEVVDMYAVWILEPEQKVLLKQIPKLRGKVLGCHCAPKLCHGHVLKYLLDNWTDQQLKNGTDFSK